MNRKTVDIFFRGISALLILTLSIAAYYSLFPKTMSELKLGKISGYPIGYLILAMAVILTIFFLLFRLIDRHGEKHHTLLFWGILLVPFIGQLVILFGFDAFQITDSYVVEDQAKALAYGYMNKLTENYFLMYGNNYLLMYMLVFIFKVTRFLHVQSYDRFILAVLNIISLDLALIFEYRTACLLSDRKKALKILVITAFNPFNVLLIYWTYTTNFSIPLMTLIGYLIVVIYKKPSEKWYQNILLGLALGSVVVWGYYMRPTAVFPFIAGIMCAGMLFVSKCSKGYLKTFPWRRLLPLALAMVLAMGVNYLGLKKAFTHYEVDNSRNLPVTHWIMMGLHGDGSFSDQDQDFTWSFATVEEMKEANLSEIKASIEELGPLGLWNHSVVKIRINWSDGTSGYNERLRAGYKIGGLYHYIAGAKRDAVAVFLMAYRSVTLFLAIAGVLTLMKKKKPDGFFLITLTLFGGFVFYLLWEVKGIYCAPFLYCLGFLGGVAADPLQGAAKKLEQIRVGRRLNLISGAYLVMMIAAVLAATAHYEEYAVTEETYQNVSLHMGTRSFSRLDATLASTGMEMTQDFYITKPINRISLPVKTLKGDATYELVLTNGAGDVVVTWTVDKSQISNDYLTWRFKSYVPVENEREKMRITIRPVSGETDSIGFLHRFSQGSDQIEGDRMIGGVVQLGDLNMGLYQLEKSTFASIPAYLIFWALILVLAGSGLWISSGQNASKKGSEGNIEEPVKDE
ncbi:MAG: hypothetical protein J5825_06350 [Lachnospiraceae bacterium]|nr:hypothetical protein [Lachnospiraceae bacterium]